MYEQMVKFWPIITKAKGVSNGRFPQETPAFSTKSFNLTEIMLASKLR